MQKFLLPFDDYVRIYQVIYSILLSEKADLTKSCLYFSLLGASILNEHYKLDARPIVGIAGYKISEEQGSTLMFATLHSGKLSCTTSGFHCWVEVNGWVLDFISPLFPKMLEMRGSVARVKSKMFQKEEAKQVASPDELLNIGDFFLAPDSVMHKKILEEFISRPIVSDLNDLALFWYTQPPNPILPEVKIGDNAGVVKSIPLSAGLIDGFW